MNGALVIEMVTILLVQGKLWSFDEARNVLIEKKNEIKISAVKILFPLDFATYLSYSEVQKKRKVDNV